MLKLPRDKIKVIVQPRQINSASYHRLVPIIHPNFYFPRRVSKWRQVSESICRCREKESLELECERPPAAGSLCSRFSLESAREQICTRWRRSFWREQFALQHHALQKKENQNKNLLLLLTLFYFQCKGFKSNARLNVVSLVDFKKHQVFLKWRIELDFNSKTCMIKH